MRDPNVWVPFYGRLDAARIRALVGTPEPPRSPSYFGGPSSRPPKGPGSQMGPKLAGSGSRCSFYCWQSSAIRSMGTLFGTYLGSQIMSASRRRTRFRSDPRLTNLGSQRDADPGRPQILFWGVRPVSVDLDVHLTMEFPVMECPLMDPLGSIPRWPYSYGIPWSARSFWSCG